MPLVASVDYPTKRIFLGIDSVGVDVFPIDIYKEMRERRRLNADNDRSFFPLIVGFGNEPAGPSNTPRYADLAAGARIVPFDTDHILSIRGNLISRADSIAGADCFDRSSLVNEVDIDYQPPQTEIIIVTTGSGVLPEDVTNIKNAVYNELIEAGLNFREILYLLAGNAAGDVPANAQGEYQVKSLDGLKDRIEGQLGPNGARTITARDTS